MKGIENVNPVAGFLGTVISSVVTVDANQDGKLTLMEIFTKVQLLGMQAFGIYNQTDWAEFKEELADLDPEEIKMVIAQYAETFDLSDDQIEWLIEDYMRVIGDFYSVINRTIVLKNNRKAAKAIATKK